MNGGRGYIQRQLGVEFLPTEVYGLILVQSDREGTHLENRDPL